LGIGVPAQVAKNFCERIQAVVASPVCMSINRANTNPVATAVVNSSPVLRHCRFRISWRRAVGVVRLNAGKTATYQIFKGLAERTCEAGCS